jgi:hypothetical protein
LFEFPLWSYSIAMVQLLPEQNVFNALESTLPPALTGPMS